MQICRMGVKLKIGGYSRRGVNRALATGALTRGRSPGER